MGSSANVLLVGSGGPRLAPKLHGWGVSSDSLLSPEDLSPAQKQPSLVLVSAPLDETTRWVTAVRNHQGLKAVPVVAAPSVLEPGFELLDVDAVAVGDAQVERQLLAALKARAAIAVQERYHRRVGAYLEMKDGLSRGVSEHEGLVLGVRAVAEGVSANVHALHAPEGGQTVKIEASRAVTPSRLEDEPLWAQMLSTGRPVTAGARRLYPVYGNHDRPIGALVVGDELEASEQAFVVSVVDNLQNHARAAQTTAALERERAELEKAYLDRYNELSQANKRLESLDAWKDQMLAMVSHDARAPLQVLLGHGRLLLDDGLDGDTRVGVAMMVKMGRKLLEMMESALDTARTTHGAVSYEPRPVDLGEVCRDVARELQILAEEKQLRLRVEAPRLLEVNGDALKLRLVLQNLIVNALQHGKGARTVTLKCAAVSAHGGGRVKVSVEDDGAGFSEAEISDLFDRYERDGIGKGLSICRELVRKHGGEIWAEHRQGGGTVFAFTVPQVIRVVPKLGAHEPMLLLADDDPNIRKSFARILGRHWKVELAADGVEAVAKAKALRPDLLLVDVFMPRKDGLDTIRELKLDPSTATMPIILMSARAEASTRAQGEQLQGVELVPKITAPEELIKKVRALLKKAAPIVVADPVPEATGGLLDRAGLSARLEEEQARALRYGRPLSVAVLKPSGPAGDGAKAAMSVREKLRAPDLLGHLGAGVLVLVLPETAAEPAQALANRLAEELDEAGTPYTCRVRQLPPDLGAAEALELLL